MSPAQLFRAMLVVVAISVAGSSATPAATPDPLGVAAQVDRLIAGDLRQSRTPVSARTADDDFLRRVTFDLAGRLPSPREVTLFGIDPDPTKRTREIERLLASDDFATNWARYWRDVIFSRATEMRARLMYPTFEAWMTEQLGSGIGWDKITRELLTATGDVRENGATALLFAHGGQPAELAAETSRIFLGIQIQCANCHDHPTDKWKREQFHQLAAFFPRVRVRRKADATPRSFEIVSFDANPRSRGRRNPFANPELLIRRLDRNRDGRLTKSEVAGSQFARQFDRILRRADQDKDGGLSAKELKQFKPTDNDRRGDTEYFMPDLSDPSSRGKQIEPVFFATGGRTTIGTSDILRRKRLANHVTSSINPWFAKAYVNRMWAEMLGEGFAMPIDDMGPDRTVAFPRVLDLLSQGFVDSRYDPKWLFRVIANTEAYQRQIQARDASDISPPFASAMPTRLRGDQLYNALSQVLGLDRLLQPRQRRRSGGGMYGGATSRTLFSILFGYDPSTPQEDISGTVPQALFMMNSPSINGLIRARGNTRLGRILGKFDDDRDAIQELYLLVLAREPSANEVKICRDYITEVGNRQEAFEDLMWSLLNSSEFLSRR